METLFDETGRETLREEAEVNLGEMDRWVVCGYECWFGAIGKRSGRRGEEELREGCGGDWDRPTGVDWHFEVWVIELLSGLRCES